MPEGIPGAPRAGDRTRDGVLEAAGEIFAQKGYDRATSREICHRAGVHLAAVNYHFGGIAELYTATLVHAHRRLLRVETLRSISEGNGSPEEKFRALLTVMVRGLLEPRAGSWELRLISREIVMPTPYKAALVEREVMPKLRLLRGIIGALIGREPEDPVVGRALFSVLAPCLFLAIADRGVMDRVLPPSGDQEADAVALIAHFERFILAGLRAVAASGDAAG
jgi:AcrR family transcriptional regulator